MLRQRRWVHGDWKKTAANTVNTDSTVEKGTAWQKKYKASSKETWLLHLDLLLTSCVTLCKSLLSGP